jgi:hypothetical protein
VAEKHERLGGLGFGTESELEDIAKTTLAMTLDAGSEGAGMGGDQVDAGIDGRLLIGWGLGLDQVAQQAEKGRLAASGTGKESARCDGTVESWGH